MSRNRRPKPFELSIPDKANRILNLILIAMVLIMARVWHLSVIQYDTKLEEAARPRKRVVLVPAKRATIRDRFNEPLAVNKVKYQAAVTYSQIKEIPSIKWEKEASGKKVKRYKRREYIRSLSEHLGGELSMDPDRIEDLIHSKAVFFGNIPFVVKEDLSEKEYYRLKMMERDWPGIAARRVPKRDYPNGKVGAEIIGTMGSINREEYEAILEELHSLRKMVRHYEEEGELVFDDHDETIDQVKKRLRDLEEHAYTINDYVGKSGIEGRFEHELRGYYGRKVFYSDAKGNYLHELPGAREPIAGNRLLLTISADLQKFAEELLIKHEQRSHGDPGVVNAPWIRGGAIVAMDPRTGDVLALASSPRFDPNDFIASGDPETDRKKQQRIGRWFEGEGAIGAIWDQVTPLEREVIDPVTDQPVEQGVILTWDRYLDLLLPEEHEVRQGLANIENLLGAVAFQRELEVLLQLSGQPNVLALFDVLYSESPHKCYSNEWDPECLDAIRKSLASAPRQVSASKKKLSSFFRGVDHNYNKAFLLDLCRLSVQHDYLSDELLGVVGRQLLSRYRDLSAASSVLYREVQQMSRAIFRDVSFKEWRAQNQTEFLKQKRKEEEEKGLYNKPYLDYLDAVERQQFTLFWERHRTQLLYTFMTGHCSNDAELAPYHETLLTWYREIKNGAHRGVPWYRHYATLKGQIDPMDPKRALAYLQSMRSFQDLDRPLVGRYRNLRSEKGRLLEKHLAAAFYPRYGFGFARSHAFRQSTVQGSIFKLVTAYETLVQRYYKGVPVAQLNPLVINDQVRRKGNSWSIGTFQNGQPIPRIYKGGRVPKSLSRNIGKIDLVGALEKSSNPYFALCAGDHLDHPHDLAEAAKLFSYGSKTGIDLPGEIGGHVPSDLDQDRNNLYASSIGQGTLIATPLQTSVMLSALANRGDVLKPKIVKLGVGGRAGFWKKDKENEHFDYQESLSFIGVDFPLFTPEADHKSAPPVHPVPTEVVREIDCPEAVRSLICEGLKRVVDTTAPFRIALLYGEDSDEAEAYAAMQDSFIGKTSSSESMEQMNFDREGGIQKITHAWFGGMAFSDQEEDPDFVVVVYLRHAGGGKYAMPLAAQMIQKWRSLQKYHKTL